MVPEAYGGLGLDCKYPAIVWEEQSYSGCSGPGFAMHSDIVAPYITNYGTEEQKERILPKLVSGEWIGALGMTEPSAGSDFANIKTVAKKDGDDYIINGSKVFLALPTPAPLTTPTPPTPPCLIPLHPTPPTQSHPTSTQLTPPPRPARHIPSHPVSNQTPTRPTPVGPAFFSRPNSPTHAILPRSAHQVASVDSEH